jgi:hypothetical protein
MEVMIENLFMGDHMRLQTMKHCFLWKYCRDQKG